MVRAGSPLALQRVSATCTSLVAGWQPPAGWDGRATAPARALGYEVRLLRVAAEGDRGADEEAAGAEAVWERVEAASLMFKATGLRPGTSYTLWVRATNAAGAGEPSTPLKLRTEQPRQPRPPDPLSFVGSPDCASLRLKFPPLQPVGVDSCGAADALILQAKIGARTTWETVAATSSTGSSSSSSSSLRLEAAPGDGAATQPTVMTVLAIDPMTVYQFRLLARNGAGISAPGEATAPMMANRFYSTLLEPPRPTATSSASFTVAWGGTQSACQPGLRWDLLYARVADEEWHVVGSDLAAETVEVPALRCAEGCAFKARPRGVDGFVAYSHNSAPLATASLPRAPSGVLRLEIRLDPAPDGATARATSAIVRALALLADVPETDVSVAERREMLDGASYVVFDLSLSPSAPAPMAVARDLAKQIYERPTRGAAGRIADALRDTDLRYGLKMISDDRDEPEQIEPAVSLLVVLWTSLRPPLTQLAAATGLPFALTAVGTIGAAIFLCLCCCCCCYCICTRCSRRRHTHTKIAQDDDDELDYATTEVAASADPDEVEKADAAVGHRPLGPLEAVFSRAAREDMTPADEGWVDDVYARRTCSGSGLALPAPSTAPLLPAPHYSI